MSVCVGVWGGGGKGVHFFCSWVWVSAFMDVVGKSVCNTVRVCECMCGCLYVCGGGGGVHFFCSEVWVSVFICVCKSVCNAYCECMCWCPGRGGGLGGSGGVWRSCVSVHTCTSSLVFLPSSFQHGLKIECMLQYVAGYPGIFSHGCILWGQAGCDDQIQRPDLNRLAHGLSDLSQDLSEGWAALLWSL